MNFIPTTFDEHQINRTVIGGKKNTSKDSLKMSVILLNSSGSHFKLHVFENLINCNFEHIISVENDSKNFSIDDIAKKFPSVKFIIPLENASDGEMINLAMSEIDSDYVMVIRDSLYIPSGVILPHLAQRLISENVFCLVPRLLDKNKNGLSTLFVPSAEKSHFVIDSSSIITDGVSTIYPFDNIAIFDRKKFINLGGYDWTIKSNYWQNLDLSIRSWLWGEQTKITTMLTFSYVDEIPVEDRTVNLDYLRYYLKNEMPRYKNDKGYLGSSFFYKFLKCSSCGYLEARRQFQSAKNWIEKNKYNFKKDLPNFIQGWNKRNEE